MVSFLFGGLWTCGLLSGINSEPRSHVSLMTTPATTSHSIGCTSKNWKERSVPDVLRGRLSLETGEFEYVVARMHPMLDVHPEVSDETHQRLDTISVEMRSSGVSIAYAEGRIVLSTEVEGVYVGELVLGADTVGLVCWADDVAREYNYNSSTGECTNASGESGLNRWPIEMIRDRSDAHCADLSGMVLGEENYSYPLLNWDFMGTQFGDAELMFAKLMDVRLDGADMTHLTMGYAHLIGQGDQYTRFPPDCEASRDFSVRCSK